MARPSCSAKRGQDRPSKAERAVERRAREQRAQRLRSLALWGGGGLAAAVLVGVVFFSGGSSSGSDAPADPAQATAQLALAESNAGSAVQVYEGNAHTVFHAIDPLPTAQAPSEDGRPLLVWFSGTWCHFCERMEPWANDVASRFTERVRFVEKSVDHDRGAASRYGVRGTPTFVLIDATGNELLRFHYQGSAADFGRTIEDALAAVGA
jgi:thiol-disulfide isomerase/thioredoxin